MKKLKTIKLIKISIKINNLNWIREKINSIRCK